MLRGLRLGAVLIALLLLPFPAGAETRLALVIGNGAYKDSPLRNPANDAALMAETLRGLGFDVAEYLDVSQKDMKRALRDFGDRLEKSGGDGVGLFYYAGHGVQVKGANYLIPVDASITRESDVEIEAINANAVLATMDHARNRLNFVILDACRNNPFARGFRSASTGLARMDAPRGTLVAYATAPGDVAADGRGKYSPYTHTLARQMKAPAIQVEQMFRRVRVKVMELTNEAQVPWEASSLTGAFYFNPEAQPAAPAREEAPPQAAAPAREPEATRPVILQQVQPLEKTLWAGGTANIRSAPTTASQRIGQLKPGEEVRVTGRSNPGGALWYRIARDGAEGFVYGDLLADQPATPPAAAPAPPATSPDVIFWQSIQDSDDPSDYEDYLARFPDGLFAGIAERRLDGFSAEPDLEAEGEIAALPPVDGIEPEEVSPDRRSASRHLSRAMTALRNLPHSAQRAQLIREIATGYALQGQYAQVRAVLAQLPHRPSLWRALALADVLRAQKQRGDREALQATAPKLRKLMASLSPREKTIAGYEVIPFLKLAAGEDKQAIRIFNQAVRAAPPDIAEGQRRAFALALAEAGRIKAALDIAGGIADPLGALEAFAELAEGVMADGRTLLARQVTRHLQGVMRGLDADVERAHGLLALARAKEALGDESGLRDLMARAEPLLAGMAPRQRVRFYDQLLPFALHMGEAELVEALAEDLLAMAEEARQPRPHLELLLRLVRVLLLVGEFDQAETILREQEAEFQALPPAGRNDLALRLVSVFVEIGAWTEAHDMLAEYPDPMVQAQGFIDMAYGVIGREE